MPAFELFFVNDKWCCYQDANFNETLNLSEKKWVHLWIYHLNFVSNLNRSREEFAWLVLQMFYFISLLQRMQNLKYQTCIFSAWIKLEFLKLDLNLIVPCKWQTLNHFHILLNCTSSFLNTWIHMIFLSSVYFFVSQVNCKVTVSLSVVFT